MRGFGPGSPPLRGTVHVPGDKSLSHRAVLFSAMAEGETRLRGVLDSADVRSTIGAVRELGAHVELVPAADGSLEGVVRGWGGRGPACSPGQVIDCGNSGTTARLLMGVLAGSPARVTLVGDESLSRRPMLRVTGPLETMGARFETAESGTLPVTVIGSGVLSAVEYASPVASAQVKSAVLLAGLQAHGRTCVSEPSLSRDHTERLLPLFGVPVSCTAENHTACLEGPATLASPGEFVVPRDPSSAAFIVAAALLVPGSEVVLPGISLNPTRDGFLRVLARMGAAVEVIPWPTSEGERVGEVIVSATAQLHATTITAEEVPSLVDEVPILALVASQAEGETVFEGVGELRVKESDRLAAIVEGLTALGARARADGDALVVSGRASLGAATLDSLSDHRLAMTWAIAGFVATGTVLVQGFEAVGVSYPGFADDLAGLTATDA